MNFKKIIVSTILTTPILLCANTQQNLNLDVLNHQQNAIADIQYNHAVSKSDKGTGATTMRGNQMGAVNNLRKAFEQSRDNEYLRNQLGISLALSEALNNKPKEAKKEEAPAPATAAPEVVSKSSNEEEE